MKKIITKQSKLPWSDQDINFLKENYKILSYREISDKLRKSYNAISHKAHKLHLDSRDLWTDDENKILIDNYYCNPDVWSLLPNRTREAIITQARKIGVTRQCGNYTIDFNFFEDWNRNSSYIIGFYLADGCVEPHLNRISCELSSNDYDHLFNIRKVLKSNNPICMKKTRNSCALFIHNKKMVNDIITKGVIPNKTNRLKLPNIPEQYFFDFLRGYIDGDGSIYLDSTDYINISILGNLNFITSLKNKLEQYEIFGAKVREHNPGSTNCYSIRYKGNAALKLGKFIYSNIDDQLYLKRKFDKYIKGFARGVNPRKINSTQISQVNTSSVEEPERKTDYLNQISVQRLHVELLNDN